MAHYAHWDGGDLILQCRLQPKAASDQWVGPLGDCIKLRITAPPVDGKANAHLIAFLARQFGISKQAVSIEKGEHSRTKRIRLQAPTRFPAKLEIPVATNR